MDKNRARLLEILHTVPLFKSLSEHHLAEIAPLLSDHRYSADHYLFFEGDPPLALYIVTQGKVKLMRHSSEGRDVVLDVIGKGQMMGEMAVFDGLPYTATAQAIEETSAFSLSRTDYLSLLERYPAIAIGVIAELSRRLRNASDLAGSLALERVSMRIARVLLKLGKIAGRETNQGVMIDMPLTRQDIADMTGTTVETAIRVLSSFRKEGVIETVDGHVIVLQMPRLRELGGASQPHRQG